MRSRPKMIIITMAIMLLIATAICTLPFPSRIDLKMTGSEISKDGTLIEDCSIRLSGWKHNYLFRNDTIKVDVQINGLPYLDFSGMYHTKIFTETSPEWDYATWAVYLSEQNQMDALNLYLAKDQTWSVVTVNDRQFVVSSDPNADLQALCCLYFIPKTTPIDITLTAQKTDQNQNELGEAQIHVTGYLKEYLFHTDTLSLNIDDFDYLYDIYPWTNRDSDGNYYDFDLHWNNQGYAFDAIFGASSTVTGEHSASLYITLHKDLKNWQFFVAPSIYVTDEAVRNDPSFGIVYRARIE